MRQARLPNTKVSVIYEGKGLITQYRAYGSRKAGASKDLAIQSAIDPCRQPRNSEAHYKHDKYVLVRPFTVILDSNAGVVCTSRKYCDSDE
jgi:hypothetical protein